MSAKKGIAASGGQVAAKGEAESENHHFATSDPLREADPLIGWFGLAAGLKESRLRKTKRGLQRGSVDLLLLLVINAITWAFLLVGGSI